MTIEAVINLTSRIVALFYIFHCLEIFALKTYYSNKGPLAWKNVCSDYKDSNFYPLLDLIFSNQKIYTLQFFLSLVMLIVPNFWCALFLFVFHLLHLLRNRGSFNGGSDTMATVVNLGLIIALAPKAPMTFQKAGLAFIAANSLLSYLLPGFLKGTRKSWLSGQILYHFLKASLYDVPTFLRESLTKRAAQWLALLITVFQIAFLSILLVPPALPYLLSLACLFHLANFGIWGLNRFVWVWLATYPSLWYFFESSSS